jgi:O-antigen/teichoic acid export membrane protein
MKASASRSKCSALAHNTFWLLGGNGFRLGIQAVYFVIIARSLEPGQYGAFVAVVALTGILSPFVGIGTCNLIIRNVARDRESLSSSWGNGLWVTTISGIGALWLILACRVVLPANIPWLALLFVASADLIFGRLTDFCGFAFSAVERFGPTAQLGVWFSLSRLMGLALLAGFVRRPQVEQWAAVYLIATAVTALGALLWGLRTFGKPATDLGRLRREIGEGFYFSAGQAAQNIYNDIDKTMLAKLGDLSATGIYGAAYRIVEVTLVPVRSLISAAYPGVFRAGQDGMSGSISYIRRMLPKAIVYSAVMLICLNIFSPLAPNVLGREYTRTVEALRWLAVLPLLKTVHSFLADALTGAGYQRLRTAIQIFVAMVNVAINLWVIPAYSWRGAAWSSIACDMLLASMLAVAARTVTKREAELVELAETAA